MPRYDYACDECDHRFEAVHPITSDALSVCPECGGVLRRVIGAVGVSFKGSGFYRTDSREAARKGRSAGKTSGRPAESPAPEAPTVTSAPSPGSPSSPAAAAPATAAPAAPAAPAPPGPRRP